jgi:GT2 family glycosyltransferase
MELTLNHIGYVDLVSQSELVGWLSQSEDMTPPDTIYVAIDGGESHPVAANIHRADVLSAGYAFGDSGFHFSIPREFQDGRPHRLDLSLPNGEKLLLMDAQTGIVTAAFTTPTPEAEKRAARRWPASMAPARIVVMVDAIDEQGITGWAYDAAEPGTPARLEVVIDGEDCGLLRCEFPRLDVKQAGHPGDLVGYNFKIPPRYFDDAEHQVAFFTEQGAIIYPSVRGQYSTDPVLFRLSTAHFQGNVDEIRQGSIIGWVIRHDHRTGKRTGGLKLLVSLHGQPIAEITANHHRADVATALDAAPDCGFSFTPPRELVAGRRMEFRFTVIPGGYELEGSPFGAEFPAYRQDRKLHDLIAVADGLYTQIWQLRRQLREMLPVASYSLENYHGWATRYYEALRARPPCAFMQTRQPLVSVLCPIFRPRLGDIIAAIASVRDQSYPHWQLILVDDASNRPELLECLRPFVALDARIQLHVCAENGGISTATNIALSHATGDYVALFDHDDVLEPRALEFMLDAAFSSGAKMLYCDEDKVDDAGLYSEPNLKPDWNYRFLLSNNYICHLLVVERAHLLKAGKLRRVCDGAQDHDLILRLAEITPASQIHHVAELLYHWRKTPQSTASSGGAKSYTVAAGVRAVADHLRRRGIEAEVSAYRGVTLYEIDWKLAREPEVSIIIPYREQIGMTEECLAALREWTAYGNYRIILADNWSTSDRALRFAAEQSTQPNTRVLRIAETFNYSRINNLAAAAASGEFLLFLNNDVVVRQADWLTRLVGEAMADPSVGAVGAKLLYPNGTVQHGGVILGSGGVADHAHRGLACDTPGYMARAVVAQEMSAVTAACMLCRREAFDGVGGFDEQSLHVAFNDVDLCLKLGEAGWRVIYAPQVMAEHRESLSRGDDLRPEHQARFFDENRVMETRWRDKLAADPHYNRHFFRGSRMFDSLTLEDTPG